MRFLFASVLLVSSLAFADAAPVTDPATWTRLAIPAATVPAAYATPLPAGTPSPASLRNATPLKFCRVRNDTNQSVSVSTDCANDDIPGVATVTSEQFNFAGNGRDVSTSLCVKYTGSAPASGTLYLNCYR